MRFGITKLFILSLSLSSQRPNDLPFDIPKKGDYMIKYYFWMMKIGHLNSDRQTTCHQKKMCEKKSGD